ncbi:restriction endonuclease subunit S [Gymnodinialimonas sp. 57CJ19]|uniref:restriction endonuclease subunit S n=1 Tax=Gymnodinialimonas sp. 57CJ19 TaxID=3138498 RepID=UPI00313423F8
MKAGWENVRLDEICKIARGGSPRPIKKFITDDPDGINWIKIGDTQVGGRYIDKTEQKIIKEGIPRSRFVTAGSFLLSNSMSFGRPYILRTDGCIHDGWLVLEPDYSRVDQGYLYYALGSRVVFDQFNALAAGSTVRNLNIDLVSKVVAPLPPLEEQKRIVAVLDAAFEGLDRARTHIQTNLQNARELFERQSQELLTKCSDAEPKMLGEVCNFENGDRGENYPGRKAFVPRGVPFINAGHLDDGRVDWAKMNYIPKEHFDRLGNGKVRRGDVLFCLRGSLGKFGLVDVDDDGAIASSIVIVRPKEKVSSAFLCAYFASGVCADMIKRFANGAAQPNLSAANLKKFEIQVPSIESQKSLTDALDQLQSGVGELQAHYTTKLADLDDLRQSLLQKAFAGELT